MKGAHRPASVARVALISGESARSSWEFVQGRSIEAIEVGSDATCDWKIDAPGVEPKHARLAFDGASLWVTSVAANVLVDGGVVGDDWVELHVGSALTLGASVLCAEAASAFEHGVPDRPTEPPKGAPLAPEETLLVQAPADLDVTDALGNEATRIEVAVPSVASRDRPGRRPGSPQLGAAASGVMPIPVAPVAPPPHEVARPLETTDHVELRQPARRSTLLVALALGAFAFVSAVSLAIGVWWWLSGDEPQALATTPETAPPRPAPPRPPPLPAGRLPEVPPVVAPPPVAGESSELARAVALVAEGRSAEAALAYETLAGGHPEHPEYALVARALRARGAPP